MKITAKIKKDDGRWVFEKGLYVIFSYLLVFVPEIKIFKTNYFHKRMMKYEN